MKMIQTTGRRKTSCAQLRMTPGTGKVIVNKREFDEHFNVETNKIEALKPMNITKTFGSFDLYITVKGGGKTGQQDAIQLALSRALVEFNEEFRKSLRDQGMLTRDPRMVERKKYGQKKARKQFQFSKR